MHSFQDKLVIYLLKRLCCKISWIIKILSLSHFPTRVILSLSCFPARVILSLSHFPARVFPGFFDQKIRVSNLWFAFIDFISIIESRFRVFLFMRKSNFLFICTCGFGIKQNPHWDLKLGWVFKFLHCQGASVKIFVAWGHSIGEYYFYCGFFIFP